LSNNSLGSLKSKKLKHALIITSIAATDYTFVVCTAESRA